MDYTYIGRLHSTHGLQGHITATHKLKGKNIFKQLKHIFVEIRPESYIPYFIEECTITAEDEVIILVDETYSPEAAKHIVGKNIYIENALYSKLQPAELTMNFEGYIVYDAHDKKVGTITEIQEMPGQLLASVDINGIEALIPLVEHHILNINTKKKEITLQIPDGLLDIYLND